MLVLSRKRGEGIVIPGCSVTVTIVAVEGNRVRLGIAAPAEVAVLREELLRRKKRGGLARTKSSNPTARP
jgi:carbon storage regulator